MTAGKVNWVNKRVEGHRNGCYNRKPFLEQLEYQDGWTEDGRRIMRVYEFRNERSCVYSTSELGQADKGCIGCNERAK